VGLSFVPGRRGLLLPLARASGGQLRTASTPPSGDPAMVEIFCIHREDWSRPGRNAGPRRTHRAEMASAPDVARPAGPDGHTVYEDMVPRHGRQRPHAIHVPILGGGVDSYPHDRDRRRYVTVLRSIQRRPLTGSWPVPRRRGCHRAAAQRKSPATKWPWGPPGRRTAHARRSHPPCASYACGKHLPSGASWLRSSPPFAPRSKRGSSS
jgi:hypothetical protein